MSINNLEMVKQAAFVDELEKLSSWGVIAKTLLTKYLPKVLGTKGTFGTIGKYLARSGKTGRTAKQIVSVGAKKAAEQWGRYSKGIVPIVQKKPGLSGPTLNKNMFGKTRRFFKPKANYGEVAKTQRQSVKFFKSPKQWLQNKPKEWIGDIATQMNTVGKRGWGHALRADIRNSRFKNIGGYNYKKNPFGQAFGVAFSGTGIAASGAISAATSKETVGGKPNTLPRKFTGVGKSLAEGAAWGTVPGLAASVMIPKIVFDTAKNKKNKQQNYNYNY